MKSRCWLAICALGALTIGFEAGGCSSAGVPPNLDAGIGSLTGGTTLGGLAAQAGNQGGQPGGTSGVVEAGGTTGAFTSTTGRGQAGPAGNQVVPPGSTAGVVGAGGSSGTVTGVGTFTAIGTVTATGTMTFVVGTGAGVETKTGIVTKTEIVTETGSGTFTSIGTETACGTAAYGPIGPCRLPQPGSGIGTGSGGIVTETFTGPRTQPGRGTQITSGTVTRSGSSIGNGRRDAGMPDALGAQPDVPLGYPFSPVVGVKKVACARGRDAVGV